MRKTVGLSHGPSKQGIPIGNLTSQIFANIYLNELDRFVRNDLKPQAYIRYGDDFVIFANSRREAHLFRQLAIEFLVKHLNMTINPKNDVIVPAKDGLLFLGHFISTDQLVVDVHTSRGILGKLDSHNIASYKALHLEERLKTELDWILLQKYIDKITE